NPSALVESVHMILAAFMATGFLVAGIHAWQLLKDPLSTFHRRACALALLVGSLPAMIQPLSGDVIAKHAAQYEPAKLAAFEARLFLWSVVLVAPLGFLAIEAGWVVTEVGRQPWIIAGIMRTADAVTPMPYLVVPFVAVTLVYLALGAVVVWLISRHVTTIPQQMPVVVPQ